jgi:hypothetical protein
MSGRSAQALQVLERLRRIIQRINCEIELNYGASLLNTLIVRTIGDSQPSPTCHSRDDALVSVAPVLERYGRFADFVDLALDEDQWG